MADEQYRWLDRDTTERLLSGEPLDAVDAAAGDQAARLAETLGALSVKPALTSDELPGEAAALAAFRKARADRDSERADLGAPGRAHPSDAGLVRLGGRSRRRTPTVRSPRWARPVRLGLAAALAVGMVGGVAVAAGTGVLPTPFDDEPGPAASVSAAEPPDAERPLASPPSAQDGETGSPTPEVTTSGPAVEESTPADNNTAEERDTAESPAGRPDGWWETVTSACRDVRKGKELDLGRQRTLEGAAGGSSRVGKYCDDVLKNTGGAETKVDKGRSDGDDDAGSGDKDDEGNGGEGDDGKGNDDDKDKGEDDIAPGIPGDRDGVSSSPPAFAPSRPERPATSPLPTASPSHSAF
ncbi:hypothetical protein StrepF001_33675 [Streptomyces sp. F001]|uniref:hypothetical protein n=1 Tax=Streptomyces sp. F001 TaxID=1510026 RepID=UPI00101E40F4|nr:hypothetical protein [Streptomyces sp. F001]RZB15120.1 hypothetical protein StrepF001_33675 [Streptomyces sp. F001]